MAPVAPCGRSRHRTTVPSTGETAWASGSATEALATVTEVPLKGWMIVGLVINELPTVIVGAAPAAGARRAGRRTVIATAKVRSFLIPRCLVVLAVDSRDSGPLWTVLAPGCDAVGDLVPWTRGPRSIAKGVRVDDDRDSCRENSRRGGSGA